MSQTEYSTLCLSSIVNVPAYLKKLSSFMETDISEDCDWRQIQLCVETIRKLCGNSMYERRAVSGKEHGGISILLRVLEVEYTSLVRYAALVHFVTKT